MPKSNKDALFSMILAVTFMLAIFADPKMSLAAENIIYVDNTAAGCADGATTYDPATKSCGNGMYRMYATIQKGADNVQPGYIVKVRSGIYYERITIANSGADGNPITIEGEDGAIIDGSDEVTGWVRALEVDPNGYGIYKTNEIGYVPWAMTADGDKNIARLNNRVMEEDPTWTWYSKYGFEILSLPPDATWNQMWNNNQEIWTTVNYWDGVGAYFGWLNGWTYVRFKDGSHPDSHNVRSSPRPERATNSCWSCWPRGSAIKIEDKHDITIRGFQIRGARYAIAMARAGTYNVIIENNHMMNGQGRIFLWSGPHDNIIRNNEMETNQYGFTDKFRPGASAPATGNSSEYTNAYEIGVKSHFYAIFKYELGETTEANGDSGIYFMDAGTGNEVYGNDIHDGAVGIILSGTNSVKIHDNAIHNLSHQGIWFLENTNDIRIYDNLLYDSLHNLRMQSLQEGNNRLVYIYNNRLYEPPKLGENMFFHLWPGKPLNGDPEFYIYHNSVSGGRVAVGFSGERQLSKFYFINNIFSSYALYTTWANSGYVNDPDAFGSFDYNWAGGKYALGVPAWLRSNNINAKDEEIWNQTTMPDFKLLPGSKAINAGVDINSEYPSLPGFIAGYSGVDGRPDMGWIQSNPADVNGDNLVNIKDIQACIKAIIGSDNTFRGNCMKVAPPETVVNIKDIQAIIQKIINP